jgi:hypothetical protein
MVNIKRLISPIISIVLVISCSKRSNQNAKSDLAKVEASILEYDKGPRNITFKIQEHKLQSNGSHIFRIVSTSPGPIGGFKIVLSENFRYPVKLDPPIETLICKGVVSFYSTGSDSDVFIKYLAKRYDTNLQPEHFKSFTEFNGISGPLMFDDCPVRIDISYGEPGEPNFTSATLDIDLQAKRIDLYEKSPEYRLPMLNALATF